MLFNMPWENSCLLGQEEILSIRQGEVDMLCIWSGCIICDGAITRSEILITRSRDITDTA